MAFPVSSLVVLMMIFSSPIGSFSCGLPQSLDVRKQETFTVLSQMGTISLLSCLKDRADFRFPQEMMDGSQVQKAQAMSVLHEMLQQIFHLFHTEGSSAAWNTTLLDQLRSGLHRQLEDLETCLLQEMGEDSVLAMEGPTLAVRRYFQRIRVYLQKKKHSDCAWEVVRVEIRRCFLFINVLTRELRKEERN
ncbi:interferon omega-1-like [Dasypus novemcinctus]|uniref:interferon omega-1-like n=1 Tax=Dasypus novemcinctus TaxID=9361 RepID=UPI00265F4DFC|nr:interferon omega-1-like [Dasypus novemcinctus]